MQLTQKKLIAHFFVDYIYKVDIIIDVADTYPQKNKVK